MQSADYRYDTPVVNSESVGAIMHTTERKLHGIKVYGPIWKRMYEQRMTYRGQFIYVNTLIKTEIYASS